MSLTYKGNGKKFHAAIIKVSASCIESHRNNNQSALRPAYRKFSQLNSAKIGQLKKGGFPWDYQEAIIQSFFLFCASH
jgi:hypothetical protein